MEKHNCTYKSCFANFNEECRQPYLACKSHLDINSKQHSELVKLLEQKGKDFYKEYRKYLK